MAVFSNTATLSYNNNIINSNTVTGELREVLSITKSAVSSSYKRGDTITYVISLVNTGTTAFSALTLTDSLGAYTFGASTLYPLTYVANSLNYYVNGTAQTAPAAVSGEPLTVSGISVPACGNVTIIYQARVNEYAPLAQDSSITNTATVTGSGLASALTAESTVTAAEESDLSITKSICPSVVSENGTLTYTFTIQNYGNTAVTAEDNAVITDIFTPILNNISVSFNSAALSSPAGYTYDSSTGTFATVAGQITVPAATYVQDSDGKYTVTPGVSTLTVSGTV